MSDVFDFIRSGGGAFPSFKFNSVGDGLLGTVVSADIRDSKDFNDPTKTVRQLCIQIKTDKVYSVESTDSKTGAAITITGDEWSVYVKEASQMLGALSRALQEGRAPKGAPFAGDRIGFEFTGTEPAKTRGHNPKKVYSVVYRHVPATASVGAAAAVSIEDL